jgi:RHS repeat-associated protein
VSSSCKERDSESGLDYFGARYYSSSMGRFMSPDSVGAHTGDPQTLNKYSYIANNPLGRVDPDWHDWADGNEGALGFFGSPHSGSGHLTDAMQKDMGQMHDNGSSLNSEQFDSFQYTSYEGKNYATFDDWPNYLLITPGVYDVATQSAATIAARPRSPESSSGRAS